MNKEEFRERLYGVKSMIDQAQEYEASLHDKCYSYYYEQLCEEVFPEYSYNWLMSTSFKLFVWNLMAMMMSVDKMSQKPKNNVVSFMNYKKQEPQKPQLRVVS